ncbi:tetratricopeptide repeat protein [Tautonia sociabilis]|uniref:Tetratricopeptide repeat protein n=1 Tax=Tautonia sociabilis TaxID=2080755 RepID=A0A432MJQ4_9BACT|nr:tetratricopeptide repeat protein [Tautonia sociabilis]RUL87415.1 tetratricopeptide repeat protein [Tautonia sociabilis]
MIARLPIVAALVLVPIGLTFASRAQEKTAGEESSGSVPPELEPIATLVGRWTGQAVPADNPLRGWRETHDWAWAFEGGEPVGLTLSIEGGTILASARLSFDPDAKVYRLEGTDPRGEPMAFVGTLDPRTKALTLDRSGPEGDDRLTIRPNSNGIRSDFWFDRKAPGSPQYARLVRANLGRAGENFAAGGASSIGPRCIVTGGAAAITVSAGGSTFSVCCSGCRDEVLANPEKYAAKLKAALASRPSGRPVAIPTGPGDGSFDRPSADPGPGADPPEPSPSPSPTPRTEPSDDPEPSPSPSDAGLRRRGASLLRIGQALEKQGKPDGALNFYRRVLSEAPDTPEADTARQRIRAIQGDG